MSLYLILDTIRPINQILLDANTSLESLLNVSRFQEIVMRLVLLFLALMMILPASMIQLRTINEKIHTL